MKAQDGWSFVNDARTSAIPAQSSSVVHQIKNGSQSRLDHSALCHRDLHFESLLLGDSSIDWVSSCDTQRERIVSGEEKSSIGKKQRKMRFLIFLTSNNLESF